MPIGIYPRTEEQKEWCRKIGKLYGGKKRILKDKMCPVCGKIFRPKDSFTKYCSFLCSRKDRPHRGIWKNCKICGKKFYAYQCFKSSKYCSRECQHKGLIIPESKIEKVCKNCGKKYFTERSGRNSSFCSMECMKTYRKTKFYENKNNNNQPLPRLKKKLWMIFSRYIRQRDGGVCISCGKVDSWKNMDAGHYIPKTAGLSIYFDERNVNCQCTHCNRFMHGNLSSYAVALRKKYGETILEELDEIRKTPVIFTRKDYEEKIEHYKKLLLEYDK